MFSLRHRLFSSSSNGGGKYSIQQASFDISRNVRRQRADLPFRPVTTPTYHHFGAEFCKTVDARVFQKQLLEQEVKDRLMRDQRLMPEPGVTWNPTHYIRQVIEEAGQDVAPKDGNQRLTPEEYKLKTQQRLAAQSMAIKHKPADLIKTGKEIHFMNGFFLSRFISDGGKILPKWRTGLNSRQQRLISKEIRKARQVGTLPIMQKYLPTFDSNLPGQALLNPLAGVVKKWKRVNDTDGVGYTDEQIVTLWKAAEEEIKFEATLDFVVKFGIPAVDNLKTVEDLRNYMYAKTVWIPVMYTSNRLRFRIAEAELDRMPLEELNSYLTARSVDFSDCMTEPQVRLRAKQYLRAFEEHALSDSKSYNIIRFSLSTARAVARKAESQTSASSSSKE